MSSIPYNTFRTSSAWVTFVRCLLVVLVAVAAQVAALGLFGCHDEQTRDPAALQRENEIKAKASYTGELLECTAKSKTLAASIACEEIVDLRWAEAKDRAKRDAGAPAKDGGK